MATYVKRVLIGLDKLGNAIADGKGHCYQAYLKETDEFLELNQFRILALVVLALIVICTCIPMATVFWFIYGIKLLVLKLKKDGAREGK